MFVVLSLLNFPFLRISEEILEIELDISSEIPWGIYHISKFEEFPVDSSEIEKSE